MNITIPENYFDWQKYKRCKFCRINGDKAKLAEISTRTVNHGTTRIHICEVCLTTLRHHTNEALTKLFKWRL